VVLKLGTVFGIGIAKYRGIRIGIFLFIQNLLTDIIDVVV